MPAPAIRLLLVDDHAMVRRGMRDFLGCTRTSRSWARPPTVRQRSRRPLALRPDIVVMDLMMPDIDGIEATARTERTAPTHVSNILAKLGLASRTQAALLAIQHRLDRDA